MQNDSDDTKGKDTVKNDKNDTSMRIDEDSGAEIYFDAKTIMIVKPIFPNYPIVNCDLSSDQVSSNVPRLPQKSDSADDRDDTNDSKSNSEP